MITSPLLSNSRHRAMITPVSPLSIVGSFILAELLVNFLFVWNYSQTGNCPWDWISNPVFYANPLLQKTSDRILIMF